MTTVTALLGRTSHLGIVSVQRGEGEKLVFTFICKAPYGRRTSIHIQQSLCVASRCLHTVDTQRSLVHVSNECKGEVRRWEEAQGAFQLEVVDLGAGQPRGRVAARK